MCKFFYRLDDYSGSKICLMALMLLFLHSCVLYPRYTRPCMDMPDQWRVPSDETSTIVNVRWWGQFNDPILNELIQEALECNKDLKVATARIAEFRAQLGIVSSQLYPQIFAQGNFSRQRISQTVAGNLFSSSDTDQNDEDGGALAGLLKGLKISPYSNNYFVNFNASYEVDLWGRIRSASDAAFADLIGQVYARRTTILTVVSSVASAYIQLRQYDQQLKISIQTFRSRQESFELAKVRFREGLTSELEVAQAASERDQAALQIIQFETLIPQQENLLSVLIGHPPAAIQRGKPVEDWPLPPEVPAGLPAELLQQRPDIVQAEDQIIAANFRIGEARALYLPDITLTGNYGYESAQLHRLFTDPSRTWQWMINLLQPIFTGWRITSTVDLAIAQKEEALYNYLQVILTALQEVNDALIAHKNSKKALFVQYEREKDLQRYLHLATLQYENGQVDYLNVLDAERRLFEAQLGLAQGQTDVFLTLVNIYKALGGGWVMDAETIMLNEWSSGSYTPSS
jgi:outer membrane protein, multidrug efflux system